MTNWAKMAKIKKEADKKMALNLQKRGKNREKMEN